MNKPPVDLSSPPNSPQAKPLALTMGDPAGIGPEITARAWLAREAENLAPFVFLGDPHLFDQASGFVDSKIPVELVESFDHGARAFASALPVLSIPCAELPKPGTPLVENAKAVLQSIEDALKAVMSGQASAIVTNPIAKAHLYKAGFSHPGHTEYLAELCHRQTGQHRRPVMMLASNELRVVPVTVHMALRDVAAALSKESIIDIAHIAAQSLRRDFAIDSPRLAITGLNPHAGESGAMGTEELKIITPAIDELRRQGVNVTGPHPADTIFHAAARTTYDAVIAMYHDQALIPIKTLAFDRAVNATLGLPVIRTSPDHGTAFDIAGKNRASARSLIEALKLARRFAANHANAAHASPAE